MHFAPVWLVGAWLVCLNDFTCREGAGGNVTIIKALGSMFNSFMSVLAEPGGGSKYFDFKPSQCEFSQEDSHFPV